MIARVVTCQLRFAAKPLDGQPMMAILEGPPGAHIECVDAYIDSGPSIKAHHASNIPEGGVLYISMTLPSGYRNRDLCVSTKVRVGTSEASAALRFAIG